MYKMTSTPFFIPFDKSTHINKKFLNHLSHPLHPIFPCTSNPRSHLSCIVEVARSQLHHSPPLLELTLTKLLQLTVAPRCPIPIIIAQLRRIIFLRFFVFVFVFVFVFFFFFLFCSLETEKGRFVPIFSSTFSTNR